MKKSKIAVSILVSLCATTLAGMTLATESVLPIDEPFELETTPKAIARRMEKIVAILDKTHTKMLGVINVAPNVLPPDPCREEDSIACRQVTALKTIDAEAEFFLAGVDALDHGVDSKSLTRRLTRSTATFGWAATRLQSLAGDWRTDRPDESPPDPCGPHILEDLEVLSSAAELTELRAGQLDSCAEGPSISRRLGHVTADVTTGLARLDALAAVLVNPPEPDSPADRELDAIIVRANALAATAKALKGSRAPISEFESIQVP